MKKILIIIPAFNEALNIQGLVRSFKDYTNNWDLLIINDGSTDSTEKIVKELGVKVINLPFNLGIGGSVQTGFKYAKKYGYDYALQFDGDGQHRINEIETMVSEIKKKDYEVVIGSRFLNKYKGYKTTRLRRIGIKIFELLIWGLVKQKITDTTSGFRAYNKKTISFLANNYPTDYPEPEAIIILKKNGFKIKEISSIMNKREKGESSLNMKGGFYMIKVSLAILMTYIRPRILW